MHDVFICYATKDSVRVRKIVAELEAEGLRCWMAPRNVRPGHAYQEEIISAIDGCSAMLVMMSRAMNASDECIQEITVARSRGENCKIIPIRIQDVKPERGYRYYFTAAQWIDNFADPGGTVDALFQVLGIGRSSSGGLARESSALNENASKGPEPGRLIEKEEETLPARSIPYAWNPLYLLFDWNGRIGRRMYLFASVLQFVIFFAAFLLIVAASSSADVADRLTASVYIVLYGGLSGLWIFSSFSITFKRAHDLGLTGWKTIIPYYVVIILSSGFAGLMDAQGNGSEYNLIPGLINLFVTGLLLLVPGQKAENKFGTKPSYTRSWHPYDKNIRAPSASPEYEINFLLFRSSGRISQQPFAIGALFCCWAGFFIVYLEAMLGGWGNLYQTDKIDSLGSFMFHPHTIVLLLVLAAGALYFLFLFNVLSKRLHDMGQSSWWAAPALAVVSVIVLNFGLLTPPDGGFNMGYRLIALVLPIILTIPLMLISGGREFNRYGPPPGFRVEALRGGNVPLANAPA